MTDHAPVIDGQGRFVVCLSNSQVALLAAAPVGSGGTTEDVIARANKLLAWLKEQQP